MAAVLALIVCVPGLVFLTLGLCWLVAGPCHERIVARLTGVTSMVVCAGAAALGWALLSTALPVVATPVVPWLHVGNYHIDLALVVDRLSWPLVMLTAILVGVVGVFSVRYVHRERGFFRFFLLLHLFSCGALLVLTAASFDVLLVGWELVGLTSVLLIAFFDERPQPVSNAVRVFAFYRVADLGLLVGIYVLHSSARTTAMATLFDGAWPDQRSVLAGGPAAVVAVLLLMAAAGKSAQAPFSGWLARAMEGPTPSSAIFYGAISVHLGAYLLLRARPLFEAVPAVSAVVVAVGAVTAVLATLVHRASSDAKTSLAYAAMAQVGIVFIEIGLGWPRIALLHMSGHAVVRTLQFLRAPSMLHDYHRVHAAAGGQLAQTGAHFERLFPRSVRAWLYRISVERTHDDVIVDRLITGPVARVAQWCEAFESRGTRPGPRLAPRPRGRMVAEGVDA